MENVKIIEIGAVVGIVILSLALHEAAHAWVAFRCGDTTARDMGRLTLNPLAHIDPFMTVLLPAMLYYTTGFIFGGARPVPVVPARLRHPSRDMMWVALAGPVSNLLIAVVLMVLWKVSVYTVGYNSAALLPTVLFHGIYANILLAVFNMLPIPPLDGSRVLAHLLPSGLKDGYAALERFGILLVILCVFFIPPVKTGMIMGMRWVWDVLNLLTGGHWG